VIPRAWQLHAGKAQLLARPNNDTQRERALKQAAKVSAIHVIRKSQTLGPRDHCQTSREEFADDGYQIFARQDPEETDQRDNRGGGRLHLQDAVYRSDKKPGG
jgi:hypothetical protein